MKLLTQNIYCVTTWDSKKDTLLKAYKEINPDILCLQELICGKTNSSEEVNDIEKVLNTTGYFTDTFEYMPNQGIFINNKDIDVIQKSRLNHSNLYKDGTLDSHPRLLIATLLSIEGKELLVINLHLSKHKHFRYQNWKEVMFWLKKSGLIKKNILVVGDFNSYDKDDVHKTVEKSGFKNAWEEVNKEKCISYNSSKWWSKNYPNHPVSKMAHERKISWDDNCIDFIFYKGDIKINSVELLDLVPEGTDHRGLILDFSL